MCRPVDGSREAACPGGHIGPPLHNAGNVPEITESGVENEHFPNGAGRSPPPFCHSEASAHTGRGNPSFLRWTGDGGSGRRVVGPYGWLQKAAATTQAAL